MLVQTPSTILKNDFRTWNAEHLYTVAEILKNTENTNTLLSVKEVILDIQGEIRLPIQTEKTLLILPLYGEVIISDFYESISAGESLTIHCLAGKDVVIKNLIYHDKADFLIFEFEKQEELQYHSKNELNFGLKNNIFRISETLSQPNFIGLYNGRAEGFYALQHSENSIFGMVISGAFEFQNRLMENRDAIVLWGIHELEFEALSEDALILFIEI
ncbi:hypothetical protein [Chryseobacterium sp. Marseille-Q3244]|uniref:pirin family protein n=1 Tax=Chryseobacterium sp. Marseille-Q3244 TaxID=2758092 RepID=UPI00202426B0|nr:hypothetical protein [Chryseobacterium sp. Marseille-Q3244]